MSLKPWREIIVPHPDVLNGTFQQSEFAADLTAVRNGNATPDGPHYVPHPFKEEPSWGVSSVNYDLKALLARA